MTHSEQGRLSPGSHSQLGVDVLEVGGDCLAADMQLRSDLGVGLPLADPHEHLGLAGREP